MARTVGIAAAVLALVAALSVATAAPAGAAPAVTVTPSTDLSTGQTVTVQGSGFSHGDQIGICEVAIADPPSDSQCDSRTAEIVDASPAGTFTAQMTVKRVLGPFEALEPDADCAYEPCAIGATDLQNLDVTAMSAPITFVRGSQPIPDARFKNRVTGQIAGNNRYGVAGQSRSHVMHPGEVWTYAVQVQNDGPRDDLVMRVFTRHGAPSNFTVRTFSGYVDISSQVTSSSGATIHDVAHGEVRTFGVQITTSSAAASGARLDLLVRFINEDTLTADSFILGASVQR
jgi:hypothetical protein